MAKRPKELAGSCRICFGAARLGSDLFCNGAATCTPSTGRISAEGSFRIVQMEVGSNALMVGQGLVCCRLASLNRAPGVIANTE